MSDVDEKPSEWAWGAEAIGQEIGRSASQVFYLHRIGAIKSAKKAGRQLYAHKPTLRREFGAAVTPEEADHV